MEAAAVNIANIIPFAAARAAHEANRAWCIMAGDDSQPTWDKAPEWQRSSAMQGVQAIIENPATTPKQSHESWLANKKAAGWIWGPEKDPEAKTHPCCVAYEKLPPLQRAKDAIFGAVVRAVLHAAGVLPRTIAKAEIESLLAASTFIDQKVGQKTTMLHVTLPNGFEMVETSGCVDPANYKHELGVEICKRRIIDRLWALEGYRLQAAIGH